MKYVLLVFYNVIFIGLFYNYSLASPFDLKLNEVDELKKFVKQQTTLISKKDSSKTQEHKSLSKLHLLRADAYFLMSKFDKAVTDYNTALTLDKNQNEAYFGKGLALARDGKIEQGIAELDTYIKIIPNSTVAYTKRGVRKLWLGDLDGSQKDLEKALELDSTNAEAHDDLGVVFSQKKMYFEAADHFLSAIEYDSTYQKAYHNMALISYLTGKDQLALGFVNSAIGLSPEAKSTVMLKSQILFALGQKDEAQELQDEAEFLPDGNWSESVPIKQ